MAANSEKREVTNEATETQTTSIPVTNCTPIREYQRCLLCENTREVPCRSSTHYPWVCDKCKEAIAFVKEFKAEVEEVPADQTNEIEASIALL